jgi:hypothetical protein
MFGVALALTAGPVFAAAPEVTRAEKEAFLKLLAGLPHRGEFFTEEAVDKAAPHTRVLLALTKADVGERDLYAFLALSRGLCGRPGPRAYAVKHFAGIAHPTMKLDWAVMLFNTGAVPPRVVRFLRSALESPKQAAELEMFCGPEFEGFKRRVNEYRLEEK